MSSDESSADDAPKVEKAFDQTSTNYEQRDNYLSSLPRVKLIYKNGEYLPDAPARYINSLIWQVGLLEFTNALDFPANVWQQIPTPLFAAVLMGIGGSIAILWSVFPFWDMHKSLENIRLLTQERSFLKKWQHEFSEEDNLDTRSLVQAWLEVNTRELGWEIIDRVMLDVCAGISGVLVGTGALMAIRGDIDAIYLASNLLSGYIGNAFLAPFALLNSFWAAFMWMRARSELKSLKKGQRQIDATLQAQMVHHGRKHRLYAAVNGVTAVAGCIGSIVSSTMWYGYVVIAPFVFSSIFCNYLWRHHMGYDRDLIHDRAQLGELDLIRKLELIQTVMDASTSNDIERLACFEPGKPQTIAQLRLMSDIGLYEVLCRRLLHESNMKEATQTQQEKHLDHVIASHILAQDPHQLAAVCKRTITAEYGYLKYQQRFLVEVCGRYVKALQEQDYQEKLSA